MLRRLSEQLESLSGGRVFCEAASERTETFQVGKAKIVFVIGKSDGVREMIQPAFLIKMFAPVLKKVQSMLKRAGVEKVWAGEIVLVPKGYGVVAHGDANSTAGGHYDTDSNSIVMYGADYRTMDELLIHELGHRWYYKFMSRRERLAFGSYFGGWPMTKPAMVKGDTASGKPKFFKPRPKDVEPGKVRAVTSYGGTDPAEDFAEVFEWYVTGKKLTRDQRERFKQFALKGGKIRRHESVEAGGLRGLVERLAKAGYHSENIYHRELSLGANASINMHTNSIIMLKGSPRRKRDPRGYAKAQKAHEIALAMYEKLEEGPGLVKAIRAAKKAGKEALILTRELG